MLYAVVTLFLIFCIYCPQLWVRYVMYRNRKNIPGMPGTGAELARHLIERFQLEGIVVEKTTEGGDHFSPSEKAVRLGPQNFDGKSLTAIAVAAHEVGHAIQFHRREPVFQLRSKYIPIATRFSRIGIFILWSLPIIGIVLKAPAAMAIVVAISLLFQLIGALAYLIILPEEWDASFNKALPILFEGEYISEEYMPRVRSVLKAAAFTYFAGALASMLNIGRWLLVFRR